jgi:hypothetical protein
MSRFAFEEPALAIVFAVALSDLVPNVADEETRAVIVMAGADTPDCSALAPLPGRLQFTICPLTEQVQPLPDAD